MASSGALAYNSVLARILLNASHLERSRPLLLDEDWQPHDRFASTGDLRRPVSLPEGVDCYALAATTGKLRGDLNDRLLGDGLVPVASALGQHSDATKTLRIPESNQSIFYGTNHLELLGDPDVYSQIKVWHS